MRAGAILAALLAVATPVGADTRASSDLGPVTTAAEARAYLDAVFAAHECRISEAALLEVMRADGQSPRDLNATQGAANPDKLMRHRRVFHELQVLAGDGAVCTDEQEPTVSIAKFGACAT